MAEQSVYVCGLCRKNYDIVSHKPLSLPCGDVFCADCLSPLRRGEDIRCPIHKNKIACTHRDLPVCQPLYKSLSPQRGVALHCSVHPLKRVKFRCVADEKFLCTFCIVPHSGTGHVVERFEVTVQSAREQSEKLTKLANSRMTTLHDLRKRLKVEEQIVKQNYENQVHAVTAAYDEVVTTLNAKRKSHLSALLETFKKQKETLDQEKLKVKKMSETTEVLMSKLNKLSLDAPLETVVRALCELQRDSKNFDECKCPDLPELVFTPAFTFSDNSAVLPKISETSKRKSSSKPCTPCGSIETFTSFFSEAAHSLKSPRGEDRRGTEVSSPLLCKGEKKQSEAVDSLRH